MQLEEYLTALARNLVVPPDIRKEELRKLFLQARPGWKGRLRIGQNCVTVVGLCTVYFREPHMTAVAEFRHFMGEFEDFEREQSA